MTVPRRERKKQAVRERLLAEARRLFLQRGIAGASAAEIAEAADVAAGTFFNHFATKDALVAELAARALAPLLRPLEAPAATSASERAAAFFAGAAETLARARAEHGELLVALLRASGAGGAIDPGGRLRRAWSQLVFEGQCRGELRCAGEAAFVAELVVGAFSASLLHWLGDPRYPLEQRMAQLASFVAGGLGSDAPAPAPVSNPHEERAA